MTIHEAGVWQERVGHLDLDYQTLIHGRRSGHRTTHDGVVRVTLRLVHVIRASRAFVAFLA